MLHVDFKFVDQGKTPKIEIGAETSEEFARVWIQDNGIGISPENHESVFKVFQRLHHNEKEYPGTGVGLAIVRKGMERMGGRVEIAPGVLSGTRFHLDFPRRKIS